MREDIVKEENTFRAKRLVYYILGILEALLGFRLILKLLGANPKSGFVSFIYSVTNLFLMPFNSIFRTAAGKGIETRAILEPSTLFAMAVYALIAWGIVKLIIILKGKEIE